MLHTLSTRIGCFSSLICGLILLSCGRCALAESGQHADLVAGELSRQVESQEASAATSIRTSQRSRSVGTLKTIEPERTKFASVQSQRSFSRTATRSQLSSSERPPLLACTWLRKRHCQASHRSERSRESRRAVKRSHHSTTAQAADARLLEGSANDLDAPPAPPPTD